MPVKKNINDIYFTSQRVVRTLCFAFATFGSLLNVSAQSSTSTQFPGNAVAGLPDASNAPNSKPIDATSLRHKVLCGYQGWFRCPDDPSDNDWVHWSRDKQRLAPTTLTFEMWPDMSEYTDEEKFPAPGFFHLDGSPAYLFSSAQPRTIDRHFDWMQEYGIDGVLVQRFVVHANDPITVRILEDIGKAAEWTRFCGRV